MRRSIRMRFFGWLGIQTALSFIAIATALFFFNLHEWREHPDMRAEETEEALLVAGAMLLLFPLALGSAWLISRNLLRPWRHLVLQAERISAGHLEERILVQEPEDEIGRLADILNTAFDNYQNIVDRLHRFTFDASHQLRNPLAALRTGGEVCLARPRSPEEYQSVVGGMLDDAQRLSRTVEQLLMLARTTEGSVDEQRERFCVNDVVLEVAEEATAVGETRNLTIALVRPDDSLVVSGVRDLMREALTNLVDNALRLSPDGSRIEVTVRKATEGRVRISVADSGPGLDADRRARLFRPFTPQRGDRGSVGLGLAIAADICKAHDGAIGVEDREGGGCVFWLELPLAG